MTTTLLTKRGFVWKCLLGLEPISADEYLELLARRESAKYAKIRGDTFRHAHARSASTCRLVGPGVTHGSACRTFPKDKTFLSRVPETALIRVVNSFFHKYCEYRTAPHCCARPAGA